LTPWTSHPPQKQKTRVRIPPGYKVFGEIISMLLCRYNLLMYLCNVYCLCVYLIIKVLATKSIQSPMLKTIWSVLFFIGLRVAYLSRRLISKFANQVKGRRNSFFSVKTVFLSIPNILNKVSVKWKITNWQCLALGRKSRMNFPDRT
jgi:hypothetical protein